jgi:hypothetical protein
MKIRDGHNTLFWKDKWLFDQPLSHLFSDLFSMCQQQNVSVVRAKMNTDAITFTRWLVDGWRDNWNKILAESASIHLSDGEDVISWKFGNKGLFSVKYVYNAMTANDFGSYAKNNLERENPF